MPCSSATPTASAARAERVLQTLLWRDELGERDVSTLREQLWDIEPLERHPLAS